MCGLAKEGGSRTLSIFPYSGIWDVFSGLGFLAHSPGCQAMGMCGDTCTAEVGHCVANMCEPR